MSTSFVFGQEEEEEGNTGEDFDIEALLGIIDGYDNFEELEKAINDSASDVNNLDLDGDGEVDYVLIQEEADGDTHVAFLRVAMAEDEYQDVATIEMEKLSATTASFQVVGDVSLYGEDYIFEPGDDGIVDISESGVEQGGKGGPSYFDIVAVRVTICVGVYRPGYRVFISPYGFRRHPPWFRPWRRSSRSSFRRRSSHRHRNSYKKTTRRRSSHASSMQQKNRKTSSKATHNKSSAANSNQKKNSSNKSNTKSQQQKASNSNQKKQTQQKSNQQRKGSSGGKKRR